MSDGEMTRAAIAAQPDWLSRVPTDRRLPAGRTLFIVRFQLLTVELAADRGIDPDPIRRDDPRWERAREAYA